MELVLRLVEIGIDGQSPSFDVMAISRPDDLGDIVNLGLTLADVKPLLAHVQRDVVAALADNHAHVAEEMPPTAASAISVSLDSTFIRGRDESERHFEVRVGNAETADGGRQIFGAVAKAGTDLTAQIQQTLEAVGRPTPPR
jgi:hypothetical protein